MAASGLDSGHAASLGPWVATTLTTPRTMIADSKRQSRRKRQIGPAAVRANTRISRGKGLIQILDDDVPERLGLSGRPRQAAHLHNDLDPLGQETTPAIGLRLGLQEGVNDGLPVVAQQSDETLGTNAKLAEKDLDRDAPLLCESDDFSAGHANPSALRARRSCSASHAPQQASWTSP